MLSPKSTERDCQLILDGNLSYSMVNSSKDFISGNYKTETTYDAVSTRNIDVNQVYWKGKNEYDEIQESSKLSQGEISFARSGHVILGGQKDNHTPIPNISKEHDLNVESNPSYSAVASMQVGEYALVGTCDPSIRNRSISDVPLKVTNEYDEIQDTISNVSQNDKSLTTRRHMAGHKMNIQNNPSYSFLSSFPAMECSLAGSEYDRERKSSKDSCLKESRFACQKLKSVIMIL